MTKKNYTDITLIVDQSTSMTPLTNETKEGYRTFLNEQRKIMGEVKVSLVLFDTLVKPQFEAVPLHEVGELEYHCEGWTAMNDAIGLTVQKLGARLGSMPEHERPETVIVVIITDGEENHSREFPGPAGFRRVAEMVKHQQEQYNWQFLFLGANIDVSKVSGGLNVAPQAAMKYAPTKGGVKHLYQASARSVGALRSARLGGDQDAVLNISEDDRAEAERLLNEDSDNG